MKAVNRDLPEPYFKTRDLQLHFPNFERKKVLVVDDEKDIRDLLVLRLHALNFEVFIAKDGLEALKKIDEVVPHLIVLDLYLPHLPGEEVCKSVREGDDERIANIPIIMLSAKGSEVDQIVGRVIGANAYITKPFDFEELVVQIEKLGILPKETNNHNLK